MPLVGYIHPYTGEKVPLDYLETDTSNIQPGYNGRPCAPPWQGCMAAARSAEDIRHAGTGLTATGATACPREIFLKAHSDYYINLADTYAMDRGTAMHSISGKWWPSNYITEESSGQAHRHLLTLNGTLFGVKQSALIDTLRLDRAPNAALGETPFDRRVVEIIDAKFPADTSHFFRSKDGGFAKPEYMVQLNQARLLLAQQDWATKAGYDPDDVDLTIWDHALAPKGEGPPQALLAWHMTEDEMLAVVPWGGSYNIEQIVNINTAMNAMYDGLGAADKKNPAKVDEIAARIPLVGQGMFRGTKCDRCPVREKCDALRATYGEPGGIE